MTIGSKAALASYVRAMMGAFAPASAAGRKLADWLRLNEHAVGIDFADAAAFQTAAGGRRSPRADRPLPQQSWDGLHAALSVAAQATPIDTAAANVELFGAAIGLAPGQLDILRFLFHTGRERRFMFLCTEVVATRCVDSLGLAAVALGRVPEELWADLTRGALWSLSLVGFNGDGVGRFGLYMSYRVVQALLPPSQGLADIERRLIGAPLEPRLALDDFAHVARERDFLLRLLRGAVAGGRKGVNVLIYGPPGTGKSEFCKLVAAAAGGRLYAIGEADEDGAEPSRSERVDALRLANALAGRLGNALLLFDEMEDILQHGETVSSGVGQVRRAGSKVFFNRLLERNGVPVLWTANAIDEFDPAFLRRMTFAMEMKLPPKPMRTRLWEGLARQEGLTLPAADAAVLARHAVAPSLMTGAAQAVAMAGGTAGEIDFVVKALARPLGGRERAGAALPPAGFEPALLNADTDPAWLLRALTREDAVRDVSLCLYGPPGTGKTAFARHLAAAMGLEVLLKRGSDLLSKWIGETEKLIAAAFEEARQDERVLIIDEAEAFLWSRGGAVRSWEVSMVNELLSAMEVHPLPFVCTTNHLEILDPAALRRFSFKVRCDYLTPPQAAAAWRRFFRTDPPAGLADIVALTPGDFAVVAKKLRVLGPDSATAPATLQLLEQEVTVKNVRATRYGF